MRLLPDKKIQEFLKNNFNKYQKEIEELIVNNKLSYLLLKEIANGDEEELYERRKDEKTIEKVKSKILKNLIKIGKQKYLTMLENYKEIIESLKNRNGYVYDLLFEKIFNYGKSKNLFNTPLDVEKFIENVGLIDELIKLPKEKLLELINNYEIEINKDFNEFVSITSKTIVSTITYKIIFKTDNPFEIDVSKSNTTKI